jgi:hypothetical protein
MPVHHCVFAFLCFMLAVMSFHFGNVNITEATAAGEGAVAVVPMDRNQVTITRVRRYCWFGSITRGLAKEYRRNCSGNCLVCHHRR